MGTRKNLLEQLARDKRSAGDFMMKYTPVSILPKLRCVLEEIEKDRVSRWLAKRGLMRQEHVDRLSKIFDEHVPVEEIEK